MENTKLIELGRAYETELAAGRYSSAEQVCWHALEICGYRGPRRNFNHWLTTARLKEGMRGEAVWLWQWAGLLADIYYELGKYTEAEPVYARLAFVWMSLPSELKGRASETRALLPDLLRKLAGAEAFIGKERRAGKHWVLAKRLSGRRTVISVPKRNGGSFTVGPLPSSRAGVTSTLSREGFGHIVSRLQSFSRYRRFRRS
jgi:hypothetical protein